MTGEAIPWNQISFPKLGIEFTVNSDAFKIGELSIKWYGILISLGLLLAMAYCFKRMKQFGLDGDKVTDAVFFGIFGGIIGARLYYIAFNIDQFKDFKDMINIRQGGIAIYGGIIGAFLIGSIAAHMRKIKLPPLYDIASMGFLIGQGIGRWGNFFNHECFGCNTNLPWGMTSGRIQNFLTVNKEMIFEKNGIVVDPMQPVHPTFLYESLWCLLGFLLLHLYYKKRKYDGEMFLMYLCWYGFERMIVEGLRTDSLMLGPIRVSQMLAGILFTISLILLIVFRIRIKKKGAPVLYVNTEESAALLKAADEAYELEKNAFKRKKQKELTEDQKILGDDDDNDSSETENNE